MTHVFINTKGKYSRRFVPIPRFVLKMITGSITKPLFHKVNKGYSFKNKSTICV